MKTKTELLLQIDRVTAERDAALAELSEIKESLAYRGSLLCRIEGQRDALQQRLTAADERVDVLVDLLTHAHIAIHTMEPGFFLLEKIDAALKPAEGGGDDYRKSCEVAHKALSMENQRITPVEKKTDPRVIDALREAGYLRND